jgi:hypothetical protein
MMTKTDRSKRTDPVRADSYAEVGRRLLHAARAISEHADSRHGSALAILAVHTTIAYAGAICIHSGGRRSTSADHSAVVTLLRDTLGNRLNSAVARDVQRVIAEKDGFGYRGYVATLIEARALFDRAERIAAWCEGWLLSAPRSTA